MTSAVPATMSSSVDAVRTELHRILASPGFANAPGLSRMLRFTVEETLEGGAHGLKELTLGQDVFGRGPDFDPRIDPIVRVQARRLRAKLDEFYGGSGSRPPVRISFAKGSYVPEFHNVIAEPPAHAGTVNSLAVLPFENFTGSADLEHLGDGLTEQLIHALTRIPNLRVVARTSAFAFKNKRTDVRTVGAALGVSHVLEGSIQRLGPALRVTAQLVSSADGYHLWSEVCEGSLNGYAGLEREVTETVSRLIAPGRREVACAFGGTLDAYQLYLKGRHLWRLRTPSSVRAALGCFEQARAVDANCALAFSGIADCYMLAGLHGNYPPKWVYPKAKEMALRAIELDPRLGEAHASLGLMLAAFDWDFDGADAAFARALELNPGYSNALHWRAGMYLIPMGCVPEAIALLQRAVAADPLSAVIRADLACALQIWGRHEEALDECDRALALDPACIRSHWVRSFILEQRGRLAEAAEELDRHGEKTDEGEPGPHVRASLAYIAARTGDRASAECHLHALLNMARKRYVAEYAVALGYLAAGDSGAALHWLNTGYDQRSGGMNWLAVDPRWTVLEARGEFGQLLSRLGVLRA